MTPSDVVDLLNQVVYMIVGIVSIMVVPSLIVGLIVAVFQAATSINEQTLSFLPRLITTLLMLGWMGHFIIRSLMEFTIQIYEQIPYVIG